MAKKKKYRKINLLETSAVGIPAYPDAHLSYKRKAVTNAPEGNEQLNNTQETKMENETKAPEVETPEVPEVETTEETEVTEEVEESEEEEKAEEPEEKSEEEAETPEEVTEVAEAEKSIDQKQLIKDAIVECLKEMNEERALVEKEAVAKETLKDKSIGELAVAQGFFK